ncbi:MAG: YcfL family protein [Gammaproteobacteria bacterium]|nr:YcfL family protein [Gammaproteobacteria bacterium]
MKVNHCFKRVYGVIFLLGLLTACSTSGIEAIGTPEDPDVKKHLLIHNDSLANQITISDMRSRTVHNGDLLEVSLTLSNLTSRDKTVQYRFSWFDGDEFEVEAGVEGWTPVSLHGKGSVSVNGLAPNSSVKSYRLNVKGQ